MAQHASARSFVGAAGPSQSAAPRGPIPTYYSPHAHELQPGPRNRLFLALRSTLPDEVDWALPRLVVGSFEHPDKFNLSGWVDSIAALSYWPDAFITNLEKAAVLREARAGRLVAEPGVKALIPDILDDMVTEKRATECMLILRNCSLVESNAKLICRPGFLAILDRFFGLPYDFLLDTTIAHPEFTNHLFMVLQALLPHLQASERVLSIFAGVLPRLLIDTRDIAMVNNILPVLIHAAALQALPTLPSQLIPYLLKLITADPESATIEQVLDLLFVLSSNTLYAHQILAHPSFPLYLKTIVPLLQYKANAYHAAWEASAHLAGKSIPNPAGSATKVEDASKRRHMEREFAQRRMADTGGQGVLCEVGDKPPALNQTIKNHLYTLPEPKRSIAWMHETFVYCSTSQLLQVTFWHAYRDFFQHPSTVQQLLSASEVIKNVTVAFPGASAKIWFDERGEQKFVIGGMGFRKETDDADRFGCAWRGCTASSKHTNPTGLHDHVVASHLSPPLPICAWATCQRPFTLSHLLTHLPSLHPPTIPDTYTVHPATPDNLIHTPTPSLRRPPPPAKKIKLSFMAHTVAIDKDRRPTGTPFLAALILRNLSRALRAEIALDESDELAREEKKKHLMVERFGLPIPDSVLREEEEEEAKDMSQRDEGMTSEEKARATAGFRSVENRVLEVVEGNMNGLGRYLGHSFGW